MDIQIIKLLNRNCYSINVLRFIKLDKILIALLFYFQRTNIYKNLNNIFDGKKSIILFYFHYIF